jgi:hypothetical protein
MAPIVSCFASLRQIIASRPRHPFHLPNRAVTPSNFNSFWDVSTDISISATPYHKNRLIIRLTPYLDLFAGGAKQKDSLAFIPFAPAAVRKP